MTTTTKPAYERLNDLAIAISDQACRIKDDYHVRGDHQVLGAASYELSALALEAERDALVDTEHMSAGQQRRIGRLFANSRVRSLKVEYEPFDLPNGYVGVEIEYASGSLIFGGIDREGQMST